jgi:uncharacterized protein YraI
MTHNTSFIDIKRQILEDQRQALLEEYQAANAQLARTLSDVDRVRLERELRDLEQRIAKTEADLAALDHPTVADSSQDAITPAVTLSPPPPSAETTIAPTPTMSAQEKATERGGWFSRLPDAGKAAVIIGVFALIVAFIYVVAKVIPPLPPQVKVTSPTLDVRYGPFQPDPLKTPPPVITVAAQGDTFEITGRDQPTPAWWQVSVLGQSGWVSGTLVTTQGAVEDVPIMTAVIALQTHYGKHVTAWNDEGDRDWRLWGWTNHPDIDEWEWFTLECFADGKAAFRTHHKKYVTATGADREWVLRADTDKIQSWELFTLLHAGTGESLPCQDVIELIQQAEEQQREVSIAIQTDHNGRYVTSEDGKDDNWRIWADEAGTITEPGILREEQKFTVIMP